MILAMLMIGEIRTSMLRHVPSLSIDGARQLLDLAPGRPVLYTERPEVRVVSPELSIGVDCGLTTSDGSKAAGVGTVGYQAAVVGGVVLQASAFAQVERVDQGKRQPWAHYAGRRHVVEYHGRAGEEQVRTGFLAQDPTERTLNLGEVCAGLLETVRSRPPQAERRIPLRAPTTAVRWAVSVDARTGPPVIVRVRKEKTRTVDIAVAGEDDIPVARRFCEDFALHDWLSHTLKEATRQAERRRDEVDDYADVLGAAIERLGPLWMPGAHVGPDTHGWWAALERSAGFSRQWELQVTQIRDRLAVRTLQELHALRRS